METMLLHASQLTFVQPVTGEKVAIKATIQPEFRRVMQLMGWTDELQ